MTQQPTNKHTSHSTDMYNLTNTHPNPNPNPRFRLHRDVIVGQVCCRMGPRDPHQVSGPTRPPSPAREKQEGGGGRLGFQQRRRRESHRQPRRCLPGALGVG